MTNDERFIGHNIRNARKEKKMTQSDLANACFISNTVISAYENGKKTPNLDTLANIARALNVSIDSLYYGAEEDAIIKRPAKRGRKIVNCFKYMYDEGMISHRYDNGVQKLEIWGNYAVMTKLYQQLSDFDHDKDKYPDAEMFLEMLLEGAGNQIDAQE